MDSRNPEDRKRARKARKGNNLSAKQKVLKEFSCLICKKVLNQPVTAPCSHTFCKPFLEGAFDGKAFVRERIDGGSRTLRKQKNIMKCPDCSNDISDFLSQTPVWEHKTQKNHITSLGAVHRSQVVMSHGLHLISNSIPGYGRSEGRCLLCSRTSSIAAVPSYSCRVQRTLLICSANSNNHRRNPDFSRQTSRPNHNFSRNRNRPNTERPENFEESEYLTSKNGPLLSLSNSPRYQATATPGPREKEIVELFRKVQAQLRSRAAIKEEKKLDTSQGQGKETETVDSLLKLLRKHSVDQGKRRTRVPNGDFGFEQSEPNHSFGEENSTNLFESNSKEEIQETNTNPFRRPASNFRRRSPVPRVKYQPVYSVEEEKKPIPEPEAEIGLASDIETDHEDPDLEPYIAATVVHEDVDEEDEEFDVMSESESDSETEEVLDSESEAEFSDSEVVVEKPVSKQETDLSSLKLPELRVLAKSRGVKGSYKLKKAELVALLSGETV